MTNAAQARRREIMSDTPDIIEAKGPSIFHDLEFEDADELLEKVKIVRRIQLIMNQRGLTQTQLGEAIGMPPGRSQSIAARSIGPIYLRPPVSRTSCIGNTGGGGATR